MSQILYRLGLWRAELQEGNTHLFCQEEEVVVYDSHLSEKEFRLFAEGYQAGVDSRL